MQSKKILPVALIVTGLGFVAYSVFGKSNTNTTTVPGTSVQTTNSGGSWWDALSAAVSAITGTVSSVTNALKSSGSFSGIQLVTIGGKNYTGINSLNTVKNLKSGNQVVITSNVFSGTYNVVQLGNAWGALTDTLIVIDKTYAVSSVVPTGTYKEV